MFFDNLSCWNLGCDESLSDEEVNEIRKHLAECDPAGSEIFELEELVKTHRESCSCSYCRRLRQKLCEQATKALQMKKGLIPIKPQKIRAA